MSPARSESLTPGRPAGSSARPGSGWRVRASRSYYPHIGGGGDTDWSVNDADQAASDADQAASDADQVASDVDQAADRSPVDEPSGSATSVSAEAVRSLRRSTTGDRKETSVLRAHTTEVRAGRASPGDASGFELVKLGEVRRALAEDQLVLFAQPIVDLSTGDVVRHELLVRMLGTGDELLLPGEFIPTAERFGLIAEIDRWVIEQASRHVASGHPVQVNVSGSTLADPDLGAFVERELRDSGADPSLVVFEITETALIGIHGLAIRFFDVVHDLGCRVAIDDFGSGYGGFRYLKSFRVDQLKIHREFVTDVASERSSAHVIRAIVLLAEEFGLETVAEGVEDATTLERLVSLGVGFGQGYYFARPAPVLDALA